MPIRLSKLLILAVAHLKGCCETMAGSNIVRTWPGICLTLLWLSVGGGCCCLHEFGIDNPHLSSCPWMCQPPQGPVTCGPCYGYHPTCWLGWSECCSPCPPPEQVRPVYGGPTGHVLGSDLVPPNPDREAVPRPKAEPSKEKPPRPIPPRSPAPHASSNHKSDTTDWGVAPLPDDILAAPLPGKRYSRLPVHAVAYQEEYDRRSHDE